mgnify:FL=1
MIAHRLSTIRGADLIIVMDKGRVAEQGSWDDLLTQKGIFRQLYEAQYGSDAPVAT